MEAPGWSDEPALFGFRSMRGRYAQVVWWVSIHSHVPISGFLNQGGLRGARGDGSISAGLLWALIYGIMGTFGAPAGVVKWAARTGVMQLSPIGGFPNKVGPAEHNHDRHAMCASHGQPATTSRRTIPRR